MKKQFALSAMFILFISISACTNSPSEQAEYSIQSFMKVNLKPENNYEPVSFSKIDTLLVPDTMTNNKVSFFKINHTYTVLNANNETVTMQVEFYMDKDFRVNGANVEDLTQKE